MCCSTFHLCCWLLLAFVASSPAFVCTPTVPWHAAATPLSPCLLYSFLFAASSFFNLPCLLVLLLWCWPSSDLPTAEVYSETYPTSAFVTFEDCLQVTTALSQLCFHMHFIQQ